MGGGIENANRIIAKDDIEGVMVSTVFLGIDYNYSGSGAPILWETMVFGGHLSGELWRYDSRKEALFGHHTVVKMIKEKVNNGQ